MSKFKDYPKTELFSVVDSIPTTHAYCITAKHVNYASDNCSGILDEFSIKSGEKKVFFAEFAMVYLKIIKVAYLLMWSLKKV